MIELIEPRSESSLIPQASESGFDYQYPGGSDLRPGSVTHNKLVELVNRYERNSRNKMKERWTSWEIEDKIDRAYVPPEEDRSGKSDFDEEDAPKQVIIPIIYMIKETIMAQIVGRFLNLPYFQFAPGGPEDPIAALLMTKVIERQCIEFQSALDLYLAFSNQLKYGIGPVHITWEEVWGKSRAWQESTFQDKYGNTKSRGYMERMATEEIRFEGSSINAFSPYLWRGDCSVSPEHHQRGENSGWITRENLMGLLADEAHGKNGLFNVKYLKAFNGSLTSQGYHNPVDDLVSNRVGSEDSSINRTVDISWQYANIIPSDYNLSDSDRPEKWMLAVAGDRYLIAADKVDLDHGKFPTAVAVTEIDGQTGAPISKLEVAYGLHYLVNMLVHTQIQSALQGLHQILIANPRLLNLYMSRRSKYGTIFFLSKRAQIGVDPKMALSQLQLFNFTQGHLDAAAKYIDIAQRVTGANDELVGGMQRKSEAPTAKEIEVMHNSSITRLGSKGIILQNGFMREVGMQMAHNTRQFMNRDVYVRMTGELEQRMLEERGVALPSGDMLKVSPMDIMPEVDLVLSDKVPSDQDPQLMGQFLQMVSQNQEASMDLDVPRIFRDMGRAMGITNVEEWRRTMPSKVRLMGTQQLLGEVQKGNLVPQGGGK